MSDEYMTSETIDGVRTKLVFKCDPVDSIKRVLERIENKDEEMLHDLQMVMVGLSKASDNTVIRELAEALEAMHRTIRNGNLILVGSAYERMISEALTKHADRIKSAKEQG